MSFGYVSGTPAPGPELHQWFNDQLRAAEMSLYGRTMWELMSGYWPTGDQQPGASPDEADFAWLHAGPAVAEIRRLTAEEGGELESAARRSRARRRVRAFPTLDAKMDLGLVETLSFPDGVQVTRYRTRR
jgi:hypothetical protein